MSEGTIRGVTSFEDVRQLVRLYGRAWPGSYGVVDLLASDADCLLLFDPPDRLVGYAFVEPDPARGFAELQDIAVDPDCRGRGLGHALLAAVQERYPALKLTADATRGELLRFYERAGFAAESTVENYYAIGRDGVRMGWRAPAAQY
jgi:ribosomal protein S18 acetylase RimI-like enzyme